MITPAGNKAAHIAVCGSSLELEASLVPWDIAAFGFRVAQIHRLSIGNPDVAAREYSQFQSWLDEGAVRLTSCRLPHGQLRESMFIEGRQFRFVEMVMHPTIAALQSLAIPEDDLTIVPATASDIPALQALAGRSFKHERYHVDPRLDPRLADERYSRWVATSLNDPPQRLLKVTDGNNLIALFITERRQSDEVYWHLTAISPEFQGRGYGRRVWRAMLKMHQAEGCSRVTTTVSARNVAALNLYGQLGFRLLPPEMTFHWLRESA